MRFFDTTEDVRAYAAFLEERSIGIIALDIEGEFNLHRYGEHLCLVQIYDGIDPVIIDPLAVDMEPVKQLLEHPGIAKIMFDCTSDRTLLFRQYGIELKAVLDLVPAVELLEFEKKGLDSVLHACLGLEKKPKKKFQRYNWMKRPIDRDALFYAMEDVTHLFDLRTALMQALEEKGLTAEYLARNSEIQGRPISAEGVPGIFRKNRFRNLPSRNRELFRLLFEKRDGYARRLDLPPNSVVSNDDLFLLSSSRLSPSGISFSGRVPRSIAENIRRDFKEILAGTLQSSSDV